MTDWLKAAQNAPELKIPLQDTLLVIDRIPPSDHPELLHNDNHPSSLEVLIHFYTISIRDLAEE